MPLSVEDLKKKSEFHRGMDGTCHLVDPVELICLADGAYGRFTYSGDRAGREVLCFESGDIVLADMFNDESAWQYPNKVHLRDKGYWWPIENFALKE